MCSIMFTLIEQMNVSLLSVAHIIVVINVLFSCLFLWIAFELFEGMTFFVPQEHRVILDSIGLDIEGLCILFLYLL